MPKNWKFFEMKIHLLSFKILVWKFSCLHFFREISRYPKKNEILGFDSKKWIFWIVIESNYSQSESDLTGFYWPIYTKQWFLIQFWRDHRSFNKFLLIWEIEKRSERFWHMKSVKFKVFEYCKIPILIKMIHFFRLKEQFSKFLLGSSKKCKFFNFDFNF